MWWACGEKDWGEGEGNVRKKGEGENGFDEDRKLAKDRHGKPKTTTIMEA